ncbi:DUF2806 domain-containing protein [Hymenobacter setariae]|uniref:DUF2806 domain-containing protein n=1 Tax=Hymenobacter setariae TaxID=2594794 RepID=A0A558BT46_9BACT|nr:DUF2806 domain-containing protein [Hymenobacter setariae]TVT39659.1 DUF2806 domain-containing protein [Hymenobacter setariae]
MPDESSKPFINISDLAGIKEALTKLIETVSFGGGRVADGINRLANAYLLASRDTQNEVNNIRQVEGAKNQMLAERMQLLTAISTGSPQQLKSLDVTGVEVSAHFELAPIDTAKLQERANSRAAYQNALHQLNIDGTVAAAAAVLLEEPDVTTEPVDQDWINRFFESAKLVSTEEMQVLWGHILAGEVKQPGSYSLRTLEVLRNLTQREAHVFRTAASFTISTNGKYSIGITRYGHHDMPSAAYGLPYSAVLELIDCGLVAQNDYNIGLHTGKPDALQDYFQIGNRVLVMSSEVPVSTYYTVHDYTKAGHELYSLVAGEAELSISFLVDFTKPMRDEGISGVV